MKRIMVFQHVPYEILGTFHPLLREGFRIRYVNFGRKPYPSVEVEKYDGLIVLGGPMGVYQQEKFPHLTEEIKYIKEAIDQSKPILGICLGAQLIASALGAKVYPSPKKEIGWHEVEITEEGKNDPFLKHFGDRQTIFQWHGDTFEVPIGATLLAKSRDCNQAFKFGKNVYGLQFHLEADQALINRWLKVPAYLKEIEKSNGQFTVEGIQKETEEHIAQQIHLSNKTFSEYIKLYSTKKKQLFFGSRD